MVSSTDLCVGFRDNASNIYLHKDERDLFTTFKQKLTEDLGGPD